MKQPESGWKARGMLLFAGIVMMIVGGILPVQAEQTGGLTPAGELLMGLLGSTVGALSPSYAPIKLQADCSADLGKCWDAKGLNKKNEAQVTDACWRETKVCPKVCKDQYFKHRKAGMKAYGAEDKVLFGEPSCIPGLDERVHSVRKVKPNNSTLQVSVTVAGKAADARVDVIPLDTQGHDVKETTDGFITADGFRYSMQSDPDALPGATIISLPAGQYRLKVSPDSYYHPHQKFLPYQAFPQQVERVSVKAGQTLEKTYTFGMGHLIVNARNKDGRPVAATLELRRWDRPDYVLLRKKLPLDSKLLAGKYRLVVSETKPRRSKVFNIEIRDGKTTSQTIMFDGRSAQ